MYMLPDWDRSCRVKLMIFSSHCLQTLGQPVPALTLQCQAPGKVATTGNFSPTIIFNLAHLQWLTSARSDSYWLILPHTKTDIHPSRSGKLLCACPNASSVEVAIEYNSWVTGKTQPGKQGSIPRPPVAESGRTTRSLRWQMESYSNQFTLDVLHQTIPHKLCRLEMKDVHGFSSTDSHGSENLPSILCLNQEISSNILIFRTKFSHVLFTPDMNGFWSLQVSSLTPEGLRIKCKQFPLTLASQATVKLYMHSILYFTRCYKAVFKWLLVLV